MAATYKHLTITVDWVRPYTSVEEAAAAAKEDFEDGLYLVETRVRVDFPEASRQSSAL